MRARDSRFSLLLAAIAVVIGALSACAMDQAAKQVPEQYAFTRETLPETSNFSGSYLAGRFAQRQQDWNAAQTYLNAVLEKDNGNAALRQRTFLLTLGAGNYGQAKHLAQDILSAKGDDELSELYLACDALTHDDFSGALDRLNKLSEEGFGQYTKPLLSAWALTGLGRKDEALKLLAAQTDEDDPTYRIHAGLIEELTGNNDAAAAHYKVAMANGLTLHAAFLVGNFFSRHDQPEVSDMIFTSLGRLYPFNPFIAAVARQDRDARGLKPNITRAADGAGYALFDLATLLYEKRAYESARVYGSLVQMLMPDSPFALLMMGDIAALNKQYPEALASYDSIPQGAPLYWLSRMRVAEVYEASDHMDMAVGLLTDLSKYKPTRLNALVSLGDLYRRHEDFAHALAAYDSALADIGTLTEEHWPVIYARGMALERLNNWTRAEKDLLQALSFQPDNPMILNFIGYSWVDKGVHLDKAMDFIRKAVLLRPDDGYILDSYGWAFFRTGRYADAVKWIEQAVQRVPDDPTILDHLGDAYWQVGRHNEARFKWNRANEISQDGAFKTVIQEKLRKGLATVPQLHAVQKEANL